MQARSDQVIQVSLHAKQTTNGSLRKRPPVSRFGPDGMWHDVTGALAATHFQAVYIV